MTDDGGTDRILSHQEGGVAWLVFNQPAKRNAISLDMSARAAEVLENFAGDEGLRVLVVRGGGDKAFVSGADISEFEKRRNSAASAAEYSRISMRMYELLAEVDKPTIAMIHGYCMGGGVALAAFCDLRICADDAQFAIPAAKLGIGYRIDFTRRVMGLIGPAFTKEILYTGRRFSAEEAAAMGLVNRVVPKAELEGYVTDYARTIAGNAPLSVKATKAMVDELMNDAGARDLARCERLIAACSDSEDFAEARRAFMEKRKPTFVGR